MTRAIAVVEGRHDQLALDALLKCCFGFETDKSSPDTTWELVHADGRAIRLLDGKDRDRAARALAQQLAQAPTQADVSRYALVFDPDNDVPTQWDRWFRERVYVEEQPDADPGSVIHRTIADLAIEVRAIPWDAGGAFDDLPPDARNLERTALAVCELGWPDDAELVDELLATMRTRGRSPSWKTAFRLMNAVRQPGEAAGFVARVFGQDTELRQHLEPVLRSTNLYDRIAWLAGERP